MRERAQRLNLSMSENSALSNCYKNGSAPSHPNSESVQSLPSLNDASPAPQRSQPKYPSYPKNRRMLIGIFATSLSTIVGINPSSVSAGTTDIIGASLRNSQISYSNNAKNINRLAEGDSSGGSLYNNNPSSPSARKRRAMLGCKINSVRDKAAKGSERECNLSVMDGGAEKVLKAMQDLDCPTCPYGIRQ
eukprot:CAMPEP_0194385818 /NCGR_PEP_ID=MMETSP0174-20130528/82662_1 /TAXON_ID=216777 /ORGANISM="Proboscia alata, Strain PI-D3" /LENGTH=190 /DNA_ID=CAMNT_0039174329 /DNA_START=236 /DNA_END=808 /DNA_ORIENTATION=-